MKTYFGHAVGVLMLAVVPVFWGNVSAWTPPSLRSTVTVSRFHALRSAPKTTTTTKAQLNYRNRAVLGSVSSNDEPGVQRDKDDKAWASVPKVVERLDQILSQLTSAFPLFVLASAVMALVRPSTLAWVNQGNLISIMLASVMCGTGLTLEPKDFWNVLKQNWSSVPLGVACQFIIMPLTAYAIGKNVLLNPVALQQGDVGSSLFLGLCLVGCAPGGTASNLVTLIAKADVALSVILTACSTLLAVVMTPFLVRLLVQSQVQVSGWKLCQATAQVVFIPVLLGMLLNSRAPKLSQALSRFTPFASVVLVSLICGGVVATSAPLMLSSAASLSTGGASLLIRVIGSVLLLHSGGFALGYAIPRWLFRKPQETSRTVSIEVGMQNSALAVVLARSIGAPAIAGLPGALSATAHSCLGSLLAVIWRIQGKEPHERKKESTSSVKPE